MASSNQNGGLKGHALLSKTDNLQQTPVQVPVNRYILRPQQSRGETSDPPLSGETEEKINNFQVALYLVMKARLGAQPFI